MKISTRVLDNLFVVAKSLFSYEFTDLCCYEKIKTKLDVYGYYSSFYQPDLKNNIHYIQINLKKHKTEKEIIETFLHELSHAYEEENGLFPMEHGHQFTKWSVYFNRLGYNILSPDCDIEEFDYLKEKTKNMNINKLHKLVTKKRK